MSLISLIFWGIIVYLVVKFFKGVFNISTAYNKKSMQKETPVKQSKYLVKKEDVIEAHFEEIKTQKTDNSKDNS
ncbi:MAG: hypothetical protein AB1775_14465 [Bacteroidota bacterium]